MCWLQVNGIMNNTMNRYKLHFAYIYIYIYIVRAWWLLRCIIIHIMQINACHTCSCIIWYIAMTVSLNQGCISIFFYACVDLCIKFHRAFLPDVGIHHTIPQDNKHSPHSCLLNVFCIAAQFCLKSTHQRCILQEFFLLSAEPMSEDVTLQFRTALTVDA